MTNQYLRYGDALPELFEVDLFQQYIFRYFYLLSFAGGKLQRNQSHDLLQHLINAVNKDKV